MSYTHPITQQITLLNIFQRIKLYGVHLMKTGLLSTNRLKEEGYNVVRSSLAEGQDFFNYEPEKWDIIVSNPPFSIKDKVLERLYSFNKPFAVLLPLNSLQGKTRYKYFKDGIQILSFDARICYHNKEHMDSVVKGSPFATAYFCKDLLPKDLIVEKLVTYERPLGE